MKQFLIMPERSRFYTVESVTAEGAYRGVKCWHRDGAQIAVMDLQTGQTPVFCEGVER